MKLVLTLALLLMSVVAFAQTDAAQISSVTTHKAPSDRQQVVFTLGPRIVNGSGYNPWGFQMGLQYRFNINDKVSVRQNVRVHWGEKAVYGKTQAFSGDTRVEFYPVKNNPLFFGPSLTFGRGNTTTYYKKNALVGVTAGANFRQQGFSPYITIQKQFYGAERTYGSSHTNHVNARQLETALGFTYSKLLNPLSSWFWHTDVKITRVRFNGTPYAPVATYFTAVDTSVMVGIGKKF